MTYGLLTRQDLDVLKKIKGKDNSQIKRLLSTVKENTRPLISMPRGNNPIDLRPEFKNKLRCPNCGMPMSGGWCSYCAK